MRSAGCPGGEKGVGAPLGGAQGSLVGSSLRRRCLLIEESRASPLIYTLTMQPHPCEPCQVSGDAVRGVNRRCGITKGER
jgi:hypothetical protein